MQKNNSMRNNNDNVDYNNIKNEYFDLSVVYSLIYE